jgi:hypothetical protein
MALKTLIGVSEIGGFKIVDMNKIKEEKPEMFRPDGSMIYHLFDEQIRPFNFIYLRHDVNSISFNIQNGPIKEVGVNGCQVLTLIQTAKLIIEKLNDRFPCDENANTIGYLNLAISEQENRTKNREKRAVEGLSKA